MSLDAFHPAVRSWFARELGVPTEPQREGWAHIRSRRHTLIAAPTGSGKTLAAFLSAIDELVVEGLSGELADETRLVYVSPLKALSNDIDKNLKQPLAGVSDELSALKLPRVDIRTSVRTGDTPARDRAKMLKRPPHLVVTTPESLFILLTSEGGRKMLSTVRTVIVDEIHALVGDKRGSHLALSLERLDALVDRPVVRIGLSATQRPIERVASFLVGAGEDHEETASPRCAIVDAGHARRLDLQVEVPRSPLEAVMAGEVWEELYDRLAELIGAHRTTLVFVNTRRLAERLTRHLAERLGPEQITSHHGSLSREHRFAAEQRLKAGQLRALVATASLELGIDIGEVDLVCQIGSTHSIAALLQRVGRSGHHLGGVPKGRLFPSSRDDLVECVALMDAVRRGELDEVTLPEAPLDILAQQIVAAVGSGEWDEDALFALVRRAYPYRALSRERFDAVVQMLWEGFSTRRGRRGAKLHRDAVNRRLRGRRGARLAAITSGGAIPEVADYEVVLEPSGDRVGTVNEDFAVESMSGDIFQLGNTSWRILRVEPGRVRVEDARGQPPTLPFWLGEAPARTPELSHAVSRIRRAVDGWLGPAPEADIDGAVTALIDRTGVSRPAAEQLVEYLAAGRAALGVMPTEDTLVLERFFDESGGMQLVLHAPLGSRVNRAWGLSLRKRFCQRFNFELQAAATEDALVLSLGPTHSFPLDEVFDYLRPETARETLEQALLVAPMFMTRWRWNATRSLAVLRFRSGKKVPPRFQRMDADDLLTVVFPDQVACQDNLPGRREIPDHPLVAQTVTDCLVEAMDIERFVSLLGDVAERRRTLVARDLTEPSPFCHEILGARPYAFLDDAPLEERRTQAVFARRLLDPHSAADLGALDEAAITRVQSEAWPAPETPDELHDALVVMGFLTREEGRSGGWSPFFDVLRADSRAAVLDRGGHRLWVAAERLPELGAVYSAFELEPRVTAPSQPRKDWDRDEALVELVRGRLEGLGPTTARSISRSMSLPEPHIEAALARLESEGFVLRGRFTRGAEGIEWCERRLLARIHRYTLSRLRAEIEPVTRQDYMRFLLSWQRATPDAKMSGPESVLSVIEQLEGFEAPAAAWEGEILPARIGDYDPAWLDALCLSGRAVWLRVTPPAPGPRGRASSGPVRSTPVTLVRRDALAVWRRLGAPKDVEALSLSVAARKVHGCLGERGASFFEELVAATGLLRTDLEKALAELVAWGLVASDSFAGLRALIAPSSVRPPLDRRRRRRGGTATLGMESAGRWSLLRHPVPVEDAVATERVARTLLARYGVVFRRLLDREGTLPPWRDLLRVYRSLEARGEIRGGRFVAGLTGEQYALPGAVEALRATRRRSPQGALVSLSAVDPLNLVGTLLPGHRVSAVASNRLLYRDGIPIATKIGDRVDFSTDIPQSERWALSAVLVRRVVPRELKAYLGRSA